MAAKAKANQSAGRGPRISGRQNSAQPEEDPRGRRGLAGRWLHISVSSSKEDRCIIGSFYVAIALEVRTGR